MRLQVVLSGLGIHQKHALLKHTEFKTPLPSGTRLRTAECKIGDRDLHVASKLCSARRTCQPKSRSVAVSAMLHANLHCAVPICSNLLGKLPTRLLRLVLHEALVIDKRSAGSLLLRYIVLLESIPIMDDAPHCSMKSSEC